MKSSRKSLLVLIIITLVLSWSQAQQSTIVKIDVFNTPPHTDSQPRFDMGSRVTHEVIKIRLDFPDVSGTIKNFKLRLLKKSDGLPLSIQPAPFDTDISGATGKFY